MANTTLGGNPVHTNNDLPKVGQQAPVASLVKTDLSRVSLAEYKGSRVVLNIFPSIDTSTCAASVRHFNQSVAGLNNTKVLCISRDLPFAQKRFCGAEGIENVECLSDFDGGQFGETYGLHLLDGKLQGLLARAVILLDEQGQVQYVELVPDIKDEPNYDAALALLK